MISYSIKLTSDKDLIKDSETSKMEFILLNFVIDCLDIDSFFRF